MSWQAKFQSPTVIAASVASLTTLCITLVTAGSALITTKMQEQSALQIGMMENRRTILLELFKLQPYESQQNINAFEHELKNMIEAGVITDDSCKLRMGLLYYSPDCKPPPNPGSASH
jgi:uncharacterized protein YjfI (DUF2170 family)